MAEQKIVITVESDVDLSALLTAFEAVLFATRLPGKIEADGYSDGVYGAGDDTGWAPVSTLRRPGDWTEYSDHI